MVAAVERIEYQNFDGTFVLKDGKQKKIFRQKRSDPDRPGKWIKKVTDSDGNPLVRIVPYNCRKWSKPLPTIVRSSSARVKRNAI